MITLGIIGVVAAMTLPTLVDSYYKQIAEARLKKFYSVFNQAILLSEAKNGPKEFWFQLASRVEVDDEGNVIPETNEFDKWFSTYLQNFMTIKETRRSNGSILYYLNDGSQFVMGTYVPSWGQEGKPVLSPDVYFYPFGNYESCVTKEDGLGKCAFLFIYCPTCREPSLKNKGLETFTWSWDGNQNSLYTNCSNGSGVFCTALIQRNGWKVPKNYPRKIHP